MVQIEVREGGLWIGPAADIPGGPWRVFDVRGGWIESLLMPTGFTPLTVAGGEVLGVHVDELGVERVWIYRLDSPLTPPA